MNGSNASAAIAMPPVPWVAGAQGAVQWRRRGIETRATTVLNIDIGRRHGRLQASVCEEFMNPLQRGTRGSHDGDNPP